jgi:hypothetical protein
MKKILWYWKLLFGTRYKIIKDGEVIQEILKYHHKIYILKGGKEK